MVGSWWLCWALVLQSINERGADCVVDPGGRSKMEAPRRVKVVELGDIGPVISSTRGCDGSGRVEDDVRCKGLLGLTFVVPTSTKARRFELPHEARAGTG